MTHAFFSFLCASYKSVCRGISGLLSLKPPDEVLAYVLERVITAILQEEILERVKFKLGAPDVRVRGGGDVKPVAVPKGLSTGLVGRGAEDGMHWF